MLGRLCNNKFDKGLLYLYTILTTVPSLAKACVGQPKIEVKMAHFTITPNDQLMEYLLLGRMTLTYVGLEAWVPKERMLPLGHPKMLPLGAETAAQMFWISRQMPLDKQAKNKQELAGGNCSCLVRKNSILDTQCGRGVLCRISCVTLWYSISCNESDEKTMAIQQAGLARPQSFRKDGVSQPSERGTPTTWGAYWGQRTWKEQWGVESIKVSRGHGHRCSNGDYNACPCHTFFLTVSYKYIF